MTFEWSYNIPLCLNFFPFPLRVFVFQEKKKNGNALSFFFFFMSGNALSTYMESRNRIRPSFHMHKEHET